MKNIEFPSIHEMISVVIENDRCYDGFILHYDENALLLANVDDLGEYNGLVYLIMDDICYIEKETQNLKHLKELYAKNKQVLPEIIINNTQSVLYCLLRYIKEEGNKIGVGISRPFFIERMGFINYLNEEELCIKNNESGLNNGYIQVKIKDIRRVICYNSIINVVEEDNELKNSLTNKLLESLQLKRIIGVFTNNENTENFTAGYVIALHEEEFLFARVTPSGEYDGYGIFCYDEIVLVENQTKYLLSLERLYIQRRQYHEVIQTKDDLMTDLLSFAHKSEKRVTLEIRESNNNDIYGIIKTIENGWLLINSIKDNQYDGIIYVELDQITNAICDTHEDVYWTKLFE